MLYYYESLKIRNFVFIYKMSQLYKNVKKLHLRYKTDLD